MCKGKNNFAPVTKPGDGVMKTGGGEESLQQINKKHEELINLILTEEEEVISMHRQHIDDMVDLIKQVFCVYLPCLFIVLS